MIASIAGWYLAIGLVYTLEIVQSRRPMAFVLSWLLWPINFYRMEKWVRARRRP